MKKLIVLLCFLFFHWSAKAQLTLSYYPLSSYAGISTNPDLRVWADLRILTNTFMTNTNMELLPMINLKNDSNFKCYLGLGVNFNIIYGLYNDGKYINGYTFAFGTRVSPFERARNFFFIAEVSPYANYQLTGGSIRTSLGLGWRFAKKK